MAAGLSISRVTHRGRSRGAASKKSSNHHLLVRVAQVVFLLIFLFSSYLLYFVYDTVTTTTKTTSTIQHDNNGNLLRQPKVSGGHAAASDDDATVVVAYAVSVTGCGSDPITEGAAILKHSIHRASAHGHLGGKYGYDLFAIYHPAAAACALPLKELGYKMMPRNVFVNVSDIEGEFLRTKIEKNGCCGEKELIKLEAYTLTQYPLVVHLDLDVLVLKPMDEIFDLMLSTPETRSQQQPLSETIMWRDKALPDGPINALYTYDYNMVNPSAKYKPVQGGFLVIRPDQTVYEEYRAIVKKGDFRQGGGWGGKVGPFHGSMTFQGLVPYYYDVLHPGQSVELNRCIYNQMADNPRTGRTVNDVVSGNCRIGTEECEDCRNRPVEDVVTTHFTLCQKPWWCLPHSQTIIQHRLCRKLTHAWYQVRSELEQSWGRSGQGPGQFESDQFFGYCTKSGEHGYLPIDKPYGPKETSQR